MPGANVGGYSTLSLLTASLSHHHMYIASALYSLSTEGTPPYKFSKIFPNDPPNSESSFHAFFITTLIKFLNKS